MRYKRTITITAAIAIAILAAFAFLRDTRPVQAQDQQPPPNPDRIAFGMVGITAGQTMRITVSDTLTPNDAGYPPGPSRVVLTFRNASGQLVRNGRGEVVRRAVDLGRGDSTFLDLNYDELPPSPIRFQTRAVATILLPPPVDGLLSPPQPDRIVSTVEVINNANGRTQYAMFTNPAVIRGFNPQPDPPLGQ